MAIFKHRNWRIVCWALELPAAVLTGVPHPSHNGHLISGYQQRAAVRASEEDSPSPPPRKIHKEPETGEQQPLSISTRETGQAASILPNYANEQGK